MCSWTLFLESKWFAFYACSEWQQEACLLLVCCFGPRDGGSMAPCTSVRRTSHRLSSWTITPNTMTTICLSWFLISMVAEALNSLCLFPHLPQPKVASYGGRMMVQLFRTFTFAWIFITMITLFDLCCGSHQIVPSYSFKNVSEPPPPLRSWPSWTIMRKLIMFPFISTLTLS